MNIKLDKMNWPEKLYQFTKVQGAVKTWTLNRGLPITENTAVYSNNYGESLVFTEEIISLHYHTSLESCYEAWIESIEKFKQKVIKQFENKCGIQYKSKTEQRLDDFIKNNWPDEVE